MTTVLLTGFEPFAGDDANPSGDAVRAVAAAGGIGVDVDLVVDVLPVTFDGAAVRMRELIGTHRPDVIVATGLAGGRSAIGVERIAVNLKDARIPDNDGAQPIDEASVVGGPVARFATLPVKAITAAISRAGIPSELSHSAGTFVCNHVFFTALDAAPAGTRSGFLHVPWANGQSLGRGPELDPRDIAEALRIAVRVATLASGDSADIGGSLH
jgi:pyroglutamyl-peptidase